MSENTDKNKLPAKAMARIKALCNGNGATQNDISLIAAKGKSYDCNALTHIELIPSVSYETKKGRHQIGALVEDFGFIDQEIQNIIASTLKNNDTRKYLSELLLKRPDKGFGLQDKVIDLDQFNRDFHSHEACQTCTGIGNTVCSMCRGQRQDVCNQCHGNGMIPCNFCHGNGQSQGADGKMRTCTRCNGTRQISCPTCQRTGKIMCRQCKGSGTSTCGSCHGAAFMTQICRAKISLKTIFEFDRTDLPDPVVNFFQNKSSAAKTPKHITLQAQAVRRDDDGLAIEYQGKFAYGEVSFKIKENSYTGNIFGNHAKLIKVPPFLRQLVKKQREQLKQAAASAKGAMPNLQKAMQSRFIEDAVQYAGSMKAEKAMRALKKKYPEGIDNQSIQKTIIEARHALKNATKNTRWMGYGIGFGLSTCMILAYFIYAHPLLMAQIAGLIIAPDLLIIGAAIVMCYIATNLLLKKKIATIFKSNAAQGKLRKAPTNWLKLSGIGVGAWGVGLLIAAFIFNVDIPWLPL